MAVKNFGELQQLAKFFCQFSLFPQHSLSRWTSNCQKFFHQTSYSRVLIRQSFLPPKLFTIRYMHNLHTNTYIYISCCMHPCITIYTFKEYISMYKTESLVSIHSNSIITNSTIVLVAIYTPVHIIILCGMLTTYT